MRTFLAHAELSSSALLRRGTATVIWAHTGSCAQNSGTLQQMSTLNQVSAAFPPLFMSGGNAGPLTNDQSRPLAAKLQGLGVEVTMLFYPETHVPALEHEYQFDLDTANGQHALALMLVFLHQHTA